MAVKFGTDGTLYCNTVRYNYKQARNMIADGSYGNVSSKSVWQNVAYINNMGYKAYRCFNCAYTDGSNLSQKLPVLYSGHIYYFSCYYNSTVDRWKCNIGINAEGSDIADSYIYKGATSGNWVQSSAIFTASKTYNDGSQKVYCWVSSDAGASIYISKFILIDLTDTFGAGQEPTKEWCDNNIREHEVYHNFGSITTAINYSKYDSAFLRIGFGYSEAYNYLQLDSNWEPREYMVLAQGSSSDNSGSFAESASHSITSGEVVYGYWEEHCEGGSTSQYFEFGLDGGIVFDTVTLVDETTFNGGGGMQEWKRASAFATMNNATGSYYFVIGFYNKKDTNSLRVTALNLNKVGANVTQYNTHTGASITVNDVNQEWCDRWMDSRSSPIIHIKDPNNRQIKLNTQYDIECNDIEIRPEMSNIVFDQTGTIKCKKLVRTQNY